MPPQVFSLVGRWKEAEASYREAAARCPPGPEAGPERGQALYCVATAVHTQVWGWMDGWMDVWKCGNAGRPASK